MGKIIKVLISLVFLWSAVGCAGGKAGGGARLDELAARDGNDGINYPAVAAGFKRDAIRTYAPGVLNIVAEYHFINQEVQIESTIHVHQKRNRNETLEQHFREERNVITAVNEDAQPLGEERVLVTKNGKTYTAYKAAYKVNQSFQGQWQPLFSEIMVLAHKGFCVKLRSVAPLAQREIAEKKNLELLDAVDWAY